MNAPDIVRILVDRFGSSRDQLVSSSYNETQIRREFIDPFFSALGWDIENKQGLAQGYKDVIHEDAIKIASATKAPDYSFRIGGTRKFFVEAKKPSINIKDDPSPAFQLRRYAWSAKLPVSILTDFDELAVYDCRIRPFKTDKPAAARIQYLTYQDYIPRWEEIYSVFSRDAVWKGSFDKYVVGTKGKRGTEEVDDAFLKEIESWRDVLARNFALRNPKLTVRELNFAVQRTIDRIIFLRICEDRGIETYGALQALVNGERIYKRLCELFYRADEKYNSGLFHFAEEKGRPESLDTLTLDLKIDDKPLKEIIAGLYYPDCPYEFSILPADILGQVYEQFLGKVIRLTTGHQAKVEEKPEVKKAGGVYYTPTYIVNYIVLNTVGKLVEGKTPKQVASLRILDPACGSGSFLIGAYQDLLDWHVDWYTRDSTDKWSIGKNATLYAGPGGVWRLTTAERKRILLSNIYGVDIDTQAVEVTKLSLLLKVLEGENEETIDQQLKMFHERALPDLGSNIKCGNSLIGPEFFDGQLITDPEERRRINAFDWKTEFKEIMDAGGFDAVIGNPPYVLIAKDLMSEGEINYLNNMSVAEYKTDLYHLFIERGIQLLREKALLGFITPNTWYTLPYSKRLRQYVLQNTEIITIDVFQHYVFDGADVHTGVITIRKRSPTVIHEVRVHTCSEAFSENELYSDAVHNVVQTKWLKNEFCQFEYRRLGVEGQIVQRILSKYPPLENVARASLGTQAYNSSKHTKDQIKNRVFHSLKKLTKEYLPELAGNDVGRYTLEQRKGEWVKYGPWLHDYRSMDWLTGPRILIREIAGRPPYRICGCFTEDTYCNYKTILNVNPSEVTIFSMKYLLGLLNSRLLGFLYPYASDKIVSKSFPRFSVRDIRQLPIRSVDLSVAEDKSRHDRMVQMVESMLKLHKDLPKAKTDHERTAVQRQIDATDKQIDALVYELYGLTEEEIRIVEGR